MILKYIAYVICVMFSAFFSASEMSYSSANYLRLENLSEEGNKAASRAIRLLDNYESTLSAILIGNNLVNIAASSLASVIAIVIATGLKVASGLFTVIATILTTILVIIFGETMPKIVAKKNANRFSLLFSAPIAALEFILRPLIRLVLWTIHKFTRKKTASCEEESQDAAVEELQSIIETAEDEAVLDEDRSELLLSALDFADISVSEIMTPRVDMICIDIENSWEEILQTIDNSPYSRLPVFEGNPDNIIGLLHLNTVYRALLDNQNVDLRSLLLPPYYVYKTVKLPTLLENMQNMHTHLAIVTDEYGGTDGLVTLEDILETLVGDIWDETDEVEPEITETAEGQWLLAGDMAIGDFLDLIDIDEEEFDYDSETLGGWTMEMLDGFAKPGDSFEFNNFSITITKVDDRRVEEIKLVRL